MKSMEPFITGFLEDNKYIGRPVDVLQMKDGSLLVSDDWNGAVYRVTYGKQKVAGRSSSLRTTARCDAPPVMPGCEASCAAPGSTGLLRRDSSARMLGITPQAMTIQ